MTKRSNRLLALASVVLLAAPLAACTSGSAGNSDLIDIEMPISTATPGGVVERRARFSFPLGRCLAFRPTGCFRSPGILCNTAADILH